MGQFVVKNYTVRRSSAFCSGKVGILQDKLPGISIPLTEYIGNIFRKEKFNVSFLNAEDLFSLCRKNIDMLILPNCAMPIGTKKSIVNFLEEGGRLLLCGGRLFEEIAWNHEGKWVNQKTRQQILEEIPIQKVLLGFKGQNLSSWKWDLKTPSGEIFLGGKGKISRYGSGTNREKGAIQIEGKFDKECFSITFGKNFHQPFKPGSKLTCFWAKGSKETTEVAVIWKERDGSNWVSVIPLTSSWKYYVLPHGVFVYCGGKRPGTSGKSKDAFQPEQAIRLSFGLDMGYCYSLNFGNHKFWIKEAGTGSHPLQEPSDLPNYPELPLLLPPYKLYSIKDVRKVMTSKNQKITDEFSEPLTIKNGLAPVPTNRGLGFDRQYPFRWIPILEACDRHGRNRGSLLSLLVHHANPYQKAMWAYLGTDDLTLIKKPAITKALIDLTKRMFEGIFIIEGGSEHFAYKNGEPVRLGAKISNFGCQSANIRVCFRIKNKGDNTVIFNKTIDTSVPSGKIRNIEYDYCPAELKKDVYEVETALYRKNLVIDTISHEIQRIPVWKEEIKEDFVRVKDGDFWIKDEKWHPIGTNYWPRNIIVLQPAEKKWLDVNKYDPDIVEADLKIQKSLGFTMVSVWLGFSMWDWDDYDYNLKFYRNVEDFILRCYRNNLRVNLFLPGLNPVEEDRKGLKLLKALSLQDNPTVFAYDIAWEPNYSSYDRGTLRSQYKRFDDAWRNWILERYGSIAAAEKDWGYRCRRVNGKVVSPATREIKHDGHWRKMVCAYYRFFTDYMSKKYREVITKIRQIDSNHLVSFRGSSPWIAFEGVSFWPISSPGVARQVDFICPEGYGVVGEGLGCLGRVSRIEDVLKGGITTIYHKFQSKNKPVFWAEYGVTIFSSISGWDRTILEPSSEKLRFQAEETGNFYKMFAESGANGACSWCFPGGYRPEERSDFGLLNLDGTPRPAADAIRKTISLFGKKDIPPNHWITIDLDAHPYDAFKFYGRKYVETVKRGRIPGVRTKGTGTTSLNTPLIAVGNTKYNGHNPLKYLNSEFVKVSVYSGKKKWIEIVNEEIVKVRRDVPVKMHAVVANLGEASWISPLRIGKKTGSVYLRISCGDRIIKRVPIPDDTPYLEEVILPEFEFSIPLKKRSHLTLEIEAFERACFGEKRKIILEGS